MLEILNSVPDNVAEAISEGIRRSNEAASVRRENFAIIKRHCDNTLMGGVTASVSFSVLFINNLWVADEHRGTGLGRDLMKAVEHEGSRRGARTACVDTLTSQVPGFYVKLGYEEFGRVKGEIDGISLDRVWFRKPL